MPALEEAFRSPGPALIEAHVDPNEPALPGYFTTDQAWNFAKALLRGEKDWWKILKNVVSNQVRETLSLRTTAESRPEICDASTLFMPSHLAGSLVFDDRLIHTAPYDAPPPQGSNHPTDLG